MPAPAARFRPALHTLEGRDCPASFALDVPGTANIYGAGHAVAPAPDGHGGGTLPPAATFAAAPGQVVTFPAVTGAVTVSTIDPQYGYANAEGTTAASGDTDIVSTGGISGITHSNRGMFLIGVFLTDAEPAGPGPARLTFSNPETFTDLAPEIAQAFFVGDGRADGSGALQRFHVPATATRLYLGFVDAWYFGNPTGGPGWFYDNAGSVAARVNLDTGGSVAAGGGVTAVGSGPGMPGTLRVLNPDGSGRADLRPFGDAYAGSVRTAVGDFNGDGVPDLAAGVGPGVADRVRVLDGATGGELANFSPFGGFTGGLFVAAGDVDGDGRADLVVTPDEGGGPRVTVYRGGDFGVLVNFFGIEDPDFRGGARAGVGDVNGDGRADVAVSAGFQGGPRVALWDGAALTAGTPARLTGDFFAFETALRNGAYVALGDVTGDGFADLIAGAGPGGGPRVRVLDGRGLLAAGGDGAATAANFFGGDPDNRGGVRVAAKDLDGDRFADVVTGAGEAGGSRVTAYLGKRLAGGTADEHFALDAFPGFGGGVFVG